MNTLIGWPRGTHLVPLLNRVRPFLFISTLLALVLLQAGLNQLLTHADSTPIKLPPSEGRKLNPGLITALSLGNVPMIIDYFTILVLSDSRIDKIQNGIHATTYFYLDAIVELDPLFSELNPLANILAVVRKDALGARDLLERSQEFVHNHLFEYSETFKRKYWPAPWQGQIFLAYVNLYELDNIHQAATAFRTAATMQGAPHYLKHLEHKLIQPGGEYAVGLALLDFMIRGAKEETYRSSLQKRHLNLSIGQFRYQINQLFQGFVIAHYGSSPIPGLGDQNRDRLWKRFLKTTPTSTLDPWGGTLYLDSNNRVASSTPYAKVFGLGLE